MLQRKLPYVSKRMLIKQLNELLNDGLIHKKLTLQSRLKRNTN